MTITSSTHLAPEEVARHTFASVRRGFDPAEVRDYLESIAIALRGVADRERELLEELADAERRAANPVLDERTLTAAIGQETARVLHSAHEVADEMVANAQTEADRLIAEATAEAERLRATAAELLATRTAEADERAADLRDRTERQAADTLETAQREGDELVARARDECKEMVEEAQQLRNRVLADFSRRRKVLHSQIEQLRAGRERLAETIVEVRRSVDTIAEDLFRAEDDARRAAEEAAREVANRAEEAEPDEVAALIVVEASTSAETEQPGVERETTGDAAAANGAAGPADEAAPVPNESVDQLFAKLRAAQDVPETPPEGAGGQGKQTATVAPLEASVVAEEAAAEPREAAPGEGETDQEVAESAEAEAEAEAVPEADPAAARRDQLIGPIVTQLARRLKRTLQDNQNELLDGVRSNGYRWSTDLFAEETEHLDGFATAAMPALEQASEAGVTFVGLGSDGGAHADALVAIADELAHSVVDPLRRRLGDDGDLAEGDEDAVTDHIGSAFREWKGERIERLAGDSVVAAFSLGSLSAVERADSGQVEWVAVAPSGGAACPDCEDNGLGGAHSPGEPFPTGHRHPPAHPGCRCMLAMAAT